MRLMIQCVYIFTPIPNYTVIPAKEDAFLRMDLAEAAGNMNIKLRKGEREREFFHMCTCLRGLVSGEEKEG